MLFFAKNTFLQMKKIVIFASGAGTNAENIVQYFKNNPLATVVGIFSNNSDAKVLDRAKKHQIESFVFDKSQLNDGFVLQILNALQPDLIVLAGFLLKMPSLIIDSYPNKIINIHPALLPKYGGKGMYGHHVHQAVFDQNEVETGITIHFVNQNYDEGNIIFQTKINIKDCISPDQIAQKIHLLECEFFPTVIATLL